MKLTEKKKKYLAVCGGIIICAGLIVAIAFQFKTEAPDEEAGAVENTATEIIVDPVTVRASRKKAENLSWL